MDVFYEESSVAVSGVKGAKKYKACQIISNVFLALGFLSILIGCAAFGIKEFLIWIGFFSSWFFLVWFVLYRLKYRFNVNYDYTFVSGELRISRVFNVSKRKPLVKLQAEQIIQVGDVDNPSFERFQGDPTAKTVYCTSNVEASEGKFFMYILANNEGKKLYVLECREELLMQMMKFLKRSVLESDYVMQERKRQKV